MSESERPSPQLNPDQFPLVGGIPLDLRANASLNEQGMKVRGANSGHDLYVQVLPTEIRISDTTDPDCSFKADLFTDADREDEEGITNTVRFTETPLTTKEGKRASQPDFNFVGLANITMDYFEEGHGPINGIDFNIMGEILIDRRHTMQASEILPADEEFEEYKVAKSSALAKYKEQGLSFLEADEKAQQDAVLATRIGRVAISRGLSRVKDVEEYEDVFGRREISGQFVRPK